MAGGGHAVSHDAARAQAARGDRYLTNERRLTEGAQPGVGPLPDARRPARAQNVVRIPMLTLRPPCGAMLRTTELA